MTLEISKPTKNSFSRIFPPSKPCNFCSKQLFIRRITSGVQITRITLYMYYLFLPLSRYVFSLIFGSFGSCFVRALINKFQPSEQKLRLEESFSILALSLDT